MYEIIIYLIMVLPFGYRNYLANKEIKILTRLLNLIISFLLFSYFLYLFRIHLWGIFREGLEYLIPSGSERIVDGKICIAWGIISQINLLLLFTIGSALGTVFKDSRKWFMRYSLLGWALYSFNIYFINTVSEGRQLFSNIGELFFYFVLYGIPLVILRFFYTRNQTKQMLDNKNRLV